MADHAADRGTADRADRAAAGKDRTTDGTYAGANRGVLVLPAHPATTAQAQQYGCDNCTDQTFPHRFHLITYMSNFG
jgi:hypothetical protein